MGCYQYECVGFVRLGDVRVWGLGFMSGDLGFQVQGFQVLFCFGGFTVDRSRESSPQLLAVLERSSLRLASRSGFRVHQYT